MKVRAKRGVCAGAGRNLKAGAVADLDPATANFLASIGAVEILPEEPPKEAAPEAAAPPEPQAPSKPEAPPDPPEAPKAGEDPPAKARRKPSK